MGWASILTLSHHIYPDLVREFYANIDNKKGEKIRSFAQGRQLTINRAKIGRILECNNQRPVIDLKKGFKSPNKYWDPSHAMTRFDLQYQLFRLSKKETILARVFNYRHRLIIYVIAHNVIPKKSQQGEV